MNILQYLKKIYYTDNRCYLSLSTRLLHGRQSARGKTLYLHIGMDKTGTSAIQKFLHLNRKKLYQKSHIIYPHTASWDDFSHHPLAFSIIEMHGYTQKHLQKYLSQLAKEIQPASKVILSSECLFKVTRRENFRLFKSFILAHFTNIHIIVYLRRQDEWVESRYKHSVLSGRVLSLEQLSRENFSNYKKFIDLWREHFPKARITARPYEKSQFKGGNIFSDFSSLVGIDSIENYHLPQKEVNTSLNNATTAFKLLCNAIEFEGGFSNKINTILLRYAREHKSTRTEYSLLSPVKRHALVQQYASCNSAIAREYGDGSETLFHDTPPTVDTEWQAYPGLSQEEIVAIGKFIKTHQADIFLELKKAIVKAGHSTEKEKLHAAETLSVLLDI